MAKFLRLTDTIYPNGRDVQDGYGTTGSADYVMSRLNSISDSTGTNVTYKYLGTGQIVEQDDAAATLSYLNSSGNVTGLDRFGRVIDQVWKDGSGTVIDEYTYQYDREGNVHSKTNATDAALDEVYGYDGIDRLTSVKDSSGNVKQSWDFDSLGNWLSFTDGATNGHEDFRRRERGCHFHRFGRVAIRRRRQRHRDADAGQRNDRLDLRLRRLEPAGVGQRRHDHRDVPIRRHGPADRADCRQCDRARLLFGPAGD